MRSVAFVAGLLFLSYAFNSCNVCSCKKVPCPAFEDADFQNWFAAYQSSQQSIFKYQSSFDTITLAAPQKNETYEASQGCFGRNEGCMMTFSVWSNEITASSRQKLSISYAGGPNSSSISLRVMGFNCSAKDLNDQGLVLDPGTYTSNYSASLTLNGTSFNNVQLITRDTIIDRFMDQPYKVYLSKGAGLIAYEMYPGRQLWVKQ